MRPLRPQALNKQLRPWISSWTSHHTAGMPRTSVFGVLAQLEAAVARVSKMIVQLDVAPFFDSVSIPHLRKALEHLRAPSCLVRSSSETFYRQSERIFCLQGAYSDAWQPARVGIAQGCPSSPLLAGTFAYLWACYAFQQTWSTQVGGCGYVDDRSLWLEPQATPKPALLLKP